VCVVINEPAAGQSPACAIPIPLLVPSPKSRPIPAEAQNLTVSGAGPDVGEAAK